VVRRELRYNAIEGCFEMAELRELDKEDDEVIDMQARWIEAEAARIKRQRRIGMIENGLAFVALLLVAAIVLIVIGWIR
jgi:hypothetical protein